MAPTLRSSTIPQAVKTAAKAPKRAARAPKRAARAAKRAATVVNSTLPDLDLPPYIVIRQAQPAAAVAARDVPFAGERTFPTPPVPFIYHPKLMWCLRCLSVKLNGFLLNPGESFGAAGTLCCFEYTGSVKCAGCRAASHLCEVVPEAMQQDALDLTVLLRWGDRFWTEPQPSVAWDPSLLQAVSTCTFRLAQSFYAFVKEHMQRHGLEKKDGTKLKPVGDHPISVIRD
ncbi:hypothetical protein DTO046C5_10082 [Penicillium roqueforti]|nr:hypothetical protein DTO046C5_10082 [Penicillium roqueforti]